MRDKRMLGSMSEGGVKFKTPNGEKLSPFQKEFLRMAAFQKLQAKKNAKL